MLSSVYIVSSQPERLSDYIALLDQIGMSNSLGPTGTSGQIVSGESIVWVRLISIDEAGYDEVEIDRMEEVLGGPARRILQLEFNEGAECMDFVLMLLHGIAAQWPIALDNCYDRVYAPSEIDRLIESRSIF